MDTQAAKRSETLRKLRKRRLWTQNDLAWEAGVSWKTIQNLENARYTENFAPETIEAVCHALEIDEGEREALFFGEEA